MKTKDLTLMANMLALLIICSQITIPMWPVPITLQTFAVLIIGMLLPPKQAFTVTALYLVMGVIGLPVFSGFKGGFSSLLSPTFGFIISFIPASVVTSILSNKKLPSLNQLLVAGIAATIIIYGIGIPYLGFILNHVLELSKSISEILSIGMIPFLIGDMIKLFIASYIATKLTLLLPAT